MKAICIPKFVPDPSLLEPSDVAIPEPRNDELLVRITHCSPQHADILHAQGKHQNTHAKKGNVHPPFILGYDFAGVIERVSSHDVSGYRPGDRVFGAKIGAFAEYLTAPAAAIRKVPEGLSTEVACAMSGQAVSYAAVVHVARVQQGDTVLVSGASGGLGSVCCMVAKALGARVIALAGNEAKAKAMRRDMDVDLVVVVKGGWVQEVQDFTSGRGVDAVLDNTGMVNDAIRCIAYGGTVVILGFAARKGIMEEVKMNKLLLKSVTVVGYRFGESGRRFPERREGIWDGYLKMLKSGQVKPLLYGEYKGLEDMGRALGDLATRKVYGKIVVTVGPSQTSARL